MKKSTFRLGALCLLAIVIAPIATARADLIGYWPFEDGAGPVVQDLSGNDNHGQLTDTAAFTDDGKFGAALNVGTFNNGAAVLLNDAANREDGAAGFDSIVNTQNATIQYWFHREGEDPQDQWEYFFGTGGNRQLSGAPWGDGNLYFDVSGCCNANQRIATSITDAHTDGQWHHVAYRKRQGEQPETQIFLDGVSIIDSGTNDINDITPIDTASIGADTNGGSSVIGRIDEFAIWDEALSDEDIIALSEGAPVLPLPEPLGDFNGDELVDTADFLIMAANFGLKFSRDDSITKGDFNGDTRVNLKDFLGFRMLINSQQGATAAVPEPSSLALLGIVGGWFLARRRRVVG